MPQSKLRTASLYNALVLIVSFGVGQGSLFLAQTWLVASDNLPLLAKFGAYFSYSTLATFLIEAGALTILPRAVLLAEDAGTEALHRTFWAVSAVRACMATMVVLAVLTYAWTLPHSFEQAYIATATPGLLVWAFNAAGLLDGYKLSGISGITNVFAYVLCAFTLVGVARFDMPLAGTLLGAAFSVGYILTVVAQFFILRAKGHQVHWRRPRRSEIAQSGRGSALMLVGSLPGQVFFRLQIALCGVLLGATATALLLYARQITAALSQLIGFLRRTEYPQLIASLKGANQDTLNTIFRLQRLGTIVAVIVSIGVTLGAACVALWWPDENFRSAGWTVALFGPGILTGALLLTLTQGAFALGRYDLTAKLSLVGLVVGSVLSLVAPPWIGIAGFALAEIGLHFSIGLLLANTLHDRLRMAR